jgi:hypothetical protein
MTMLMNDNMHGTRSRVEGAVGGNNLGIAGSGLECKTDAPESFSEQWPGKCQHYRLNHNTPAIIMAQQ